MSRGLTNMLSGQGANTCASFSCTVKLCIKSLVPLLPLFFFPVSFEHYFATKPMPGALHPSFSFMKIPCDLHFTSKETQV